FRAYAPATLSCIPGARAAVEQLRANGGMVVGLVTDGDVAIQHSKLAALGLADVFDVVVFSDALGREYRKPHPAPFRAALRAVDVSPSRAVYIGDRPDKDIVGAHRAGMRAIRVHTGEYAHV